MQRFYFDVQNGQAETDHVGVLCRDIEEVHACAVRTAASIAVEEAVIRDPYDIIIIARNEDGQTVLKTSLHIASM
ncbi:DUF6894 family protein [Methylobacterium phyllostachyos]|uniref:DUF6894 family protein n=1 Tax=Methylobacterium phyllostachyos TaxID=582672 RepID=UPI00115FE2E7|nr:hypothetical protein [Methylobacterium phyllostachyos]